MAPPTRRALGAWERHWQRLVTAWAGVTDNNQRYFAIGGNDGTNDLAVNAVYNPTTNSWTTLAPMPTARMNIQAASIGGLLYVPGGYLASSDTFVSIHEAYDIARNTWGQLRRRSRSSCQGR